MTNPNIPEHAVFRFRSINALLGDFDELEKQSIYFSAPDQLNDPMEGIRQFHWKGDRIMWSNLLRHYIICLSNRCFQYVVVGENIDLGEDGIAVFQTLRNLPTPEARKLFEDCLNAVTTSQNYGLVLDILSSTNRAISRAELFTTLNTVHMEWVMFILTVFHKHGLMPTAPPPLPYPAGMTSYLKTYRDTVPDLLQESPDTVLEVLGEAVAFMHEEIDILNFYYNHKKYRSNQMSLFMRFPNQYLNSIVQLAYPQWYASCFSKAYDNASMWSYYANNHNGCCLIFTPSIKGGKPYLPLRGVVGNGSSGLSDHRCDYLLEDVNYAVDIPSLNFFETIGRLSHRDTIENWFCSQDGEISSLASHLDDENIAAWRNRYWGTFHEALLRKLKDWEHEQESRIILPDTLDLHQKSDDRLFEYDFNTLDGIIFGIRVSMMDKVRIMQIFDRKLSASPRPNPFKFFQAQFNPRSGRVQAEHLSLFNNSQSE